MKFVVTIRAFIEAPDDASAQRQANAIDSALKDPLVKLALSQKGLVTRGHVVEKPRRES